jgi:hypothetical protein
MDKMSVDKGNEREKTGRIVRGPRNVDQTMLTVIYRNCY